MAIRWLALAGAVGVTALFTPPLHAQAATGASSAASQALLGTPPSRSGFVNLDVRPEDRMTTPAERALLGASSGMRLELTGEPARDRRSAGEAALLGR